MPMTSPTGWVFLSSGNCTIRWRRGDNVAYIFNGKQMETYPDESQRVDFLATIPVSFQGWTDLADIRLAGEKWAKTARKRCSTARRVAGLRDYSTIARRYQGWPLLDRRSVLFVAYTLDK